ncbi:MAG: hypothetical protein ACF8CQ_23425, partial [Rhodopirellula sp. JB044]
MLRTFGQPPPYQSHDAGPWHRFVFRVFSWFDVCFRQWHGGCYHPYPADAETHPAGIDGDRQTKPLSNLHNQIPNAANLMTQPVTLEPVTENHLDIIHYAKSRYSTKTYDSTRKISDDDI